MTQQKSLIHQEKGVFQNQSHQQNLKRIARKSILFQLEKPKNKAQNNWVQEMMRATIVSDAAAVLVHRPACRTAFPSSSLTPLILSVYPRYECSKE